MNITVITGSVHRHGTSALLADKFIEGATEAGHEVFRFDGIDEPKRPAPLLQLQSVERTCDTVRMRY